MNSVVTEVEAEEKCWRLLRKTLHIPLAVFLAMTLALDVIARNEV